MERGRRPRSCLASAIPGGLGSPSVRTDRRTAFDGWTGTGRAGRKPGARGREERSAGSQEARSRGQKPPSWSAGRRCAFARRFRSLWRGARMKAVAPAGAPAPFSWSGEGEMTKPRGRNRLARTIAAAFPGRGRRPRAGVQGCRLGGCGPGPRVSRYRARPGNEGKDGCCLKIDSETALRSPAEAEGREPGSRVVGSAGAALDPGSRAIALARGTKESMVAV